jgi:hypothetical protein
MKTSTLVFRGVVLLLFVGLLSSCQTGRSGMKSHMRQFEMVKVDPVSRQAPDQHHAVVEVAEKEAVAEVVKDLQQTDATETAVDAIPVNPIDFSLMTEEVVSQLPLNRVQRFAANRLMRNAMSQVAGVAGADQALTSSGEQVFGLQQLLEERRELKEKKSGKSSIDLLRLILYLLVALLIITILGMLFSGHLFTIVVLVLLILGVLYLLGAV